MANTNSGDEESNILPLELWLQIFSYLSSEDIRSMTLTCSSFRLLSQPLLFTVIDVSPFFLSYNGGGRILRPRKYLDRTIQRLEFYRSPNIAPAVKHCWISPYSRNGFPPRNNRDYLDPHLIINAVIDSLPSFINLRQLSWHCIDISAAWWNAIHELSITSLWLNSCTVEDTTPPPLSVQDLNLDQWAWKGEVTNHVSIHEEQSMGVTRAILPLILDLDRTRYISVPRTDTCHHLLSTIAEMGPFISLRVLHIPFSAMASPYFTQTLVHCSSLEELRFFKPTGVQPQEIIMDPLPPFTLPFLTVYEGPYTHLLSFATGRPLKKIIVWGLDGSPALCDPHRLLGYLRQLSSMNLPLDTLQLTVSYITDDLLAVFSLFTTLKHVEVSSADNLSSTTTPVTSVQLSSETPMIVLYLLLRDVTLPPELETLRIFTKLLHGNLDIPTQELEVSRLIEGMAHSLPMLHSVEIAYGTYWTGTYLARWNRSWASTDDSQGDLGKLFLSEHKRNIVFHDGRRVDTHGDQIKLAKGKFFSFTWLRRFLYGYLR